jgi:hypothetical protein
LSITTTITVIMSHSITWHLLMFTSEGDVNGSMCGISSSVKPWNLEELIIWGKEVSKNTCYWGKVHLNF